MTDIIEEMLKISRRLGDEPDPIVHGWEKVETVYTMYMPMPEPVRAIGDDSPDVEYFYSEATPHYRAEEGYLDRAQSAAIAYPALQKKN